MKNTTKRVKRKLVNIITHLLPFNSKFRPRGCYDTSESYLKKNQASGVKCCEIYPEHVTSLTLSKSLLEALPSYSLRDNLSFQPEPTLHTKTNYVVTEIPNGSIYTDNQTFVAIMTEDRQVLADVSYLQKKNKNSSFSEHKFFKQKFFIKPKKYSGTVFNMLAGGGATDGNYSHWLIDVLPRIHLLKESGWYEKVDWFLVPSYRIDFQIDTLKLLGIDQSKVIIAREPFHLQADNLISTSNPRGQKSYLIPDWMHQFLRESFLTQELSNYDDYSLLYISRKDSKVRNVTNESELIQLLHQYGFKSVELSKFNFLEKVKLFSSAKMIISAHGAGLTNLLFARANSVFIELYSEGFVNTVFYNIARITGMDYHYLICRSKTKSKIRTQAIKEHTTVNLNDLKRILDNQLISNNQV